MSTVQTIIANGFAKSAAARPDTITATPELVARIGQCLLEVFQVLGRENPYLIGLSASVAFDGTGWPRPVDALRVLNLFASASTIANPVIASGTELNVVPFDDQRFLEGDACLTELGQRFIPTGQAMDPSDGAITMIYARAPIIPVLDTESIDPLYPQPFDSLLEFDLAAYLATKDERTKDEETFLGFKNAQMQLLIDWARGQTYNLKQRFPLVTPPLTNTAGGRQQPVQG